MDDYLEYVLNLFKVENRNQWETKVESMFEINQGFGDVLLAGDTKMEVVRNFDDLKREQNTNFFYLIPKTEGIKGRACIENINLLDLVPANYDVYYYSKYSPSLVKDSYRSNIHHVLNDGKTLLQSKKGPYKGRCYIGFDEFWGSDSESFRRLRSKHKDIHKYIYMFGFKKCLETKQIDSLYKEYVSLVHIDFSRAAVRDKKKNDLEFVIKRLNLQPGSEWRAVYYYFANNPFKNHLIVDQDVDFRFRELIKPEIQSQKSFLYLISKNDKQVICLGQQKLSGDYIDGVPKHTELSLVKQAEEVLKKKS